MSVHSKKGPVLSERQRVEGFTLVELLVVISIIAILAVIGITVFSGVQKGARDARRKGDLHAISLALEQYKATTGTYPNLSAWSSHLVAPVAVEWTTLGTNLANYIQSIPIDPLNNDDGACDTQTTCHLYHYCSDGTYFILAVNLEGSSTQAAPPSTCPTGGPNYYWIQNQQ